MTPDDPRHGTKAGYRHGCRNPCCRRAQMIYMKKWRMGQLDQLIDATGTRRRIQALMAIGYSHAELGRILNRSRNYTHELMTEDIRVVESTASAIAELFELLCMVPAAGPYVVRTRKFAARSGYAPPLAWDDIDDPNEAPNVSPQNAEWQQDVDEAIVLRVVNEGGKRPRQLTSAEAEECVRILIARGHTSTVIQDVYGLKAERYFRIERAA